MNFYIIMNPRTVKRRFVDTTDALFLLVKFRYARVDRVLTSCNINTLYS